MGLFRRKRLPSDTAAGHGRTSFLVDVRLLSAEEDGRSAPVVGRYRPQLHIGQRRRDGERIEWDCEWSVDEAIPPGGRGPVVMRLFGLPDVALQEEEHLEFYEGHRKVAVGHVVAVQSPEAPDDDPLVFVMMDAFDGEAITSVFHEEDGDWQFLTGPLATQENARLVHLSHVMALDPTLSQLEDMPQGMWAHRHGRDQPWHIERDSEDIERDSEDSD